MSDARWAEIEAAVGLGSARYLAKYLDASSGAKLPHLCINALAVRRDSGIALDHRPPSAANSCSTTTRNDGK
jgi:hypothetical protein